MARRKQNTRRKAAKVVSINMDVTIAEAKRVGTLVQTMQRFKRERAALEELGVTVIVNMPSVEFWYLLHFEKTGKYFPKQDPLIRRLKKHLPDYAKSEKYYKQPRNQTLYDRLREQRDQAIDRSHALYRFDPDDPERACCEMGWLFVALGLYTQ